MAEVEAQEREIANLNRVNQQLQDTINQLRYELEAASNVTAVAVQSAQAVMAGEVAQLRDTIQSMRDALTAAHSAGDSQTQAARATAEAEIRQLRATIDVLRGEVEKSRADAAVAVDREALAHMRERQTLQDQIQAMRSTMELAA